MTMTAKYPGRCRKCGRPIRVGDAIEWERGKGAAHVDCGAAKPQAAASSDAVIKVSRGQGYGGRPYTEGATIIDSRSGKYLVVVRAWQRYVREDGMSFGVGDDSGYIYGADCREATAEEIAEYEAAKTAKAEAARAPYINTANDSVEITAVFQEGEYYSGMTVCGREAQELLETIKGGHYLPGWGWALDSALAELGERFTFGQAREIMLARYDAAHK